MIMDTLYFLLSALDTVTHYLCISGHLTKHQAVVCINVWHKIVWISRKVPNCGELIPGSWCIIQDSLCVCNSFFSNLVRYRPVHSWQALRFESSPTKRSDYHYNSLACQWLWPATINLNSWLCTWMYSPNTCVISQYRTCRLVEVCVCNCRAL